MGQTGNKDGFAHNLDFHYQICKIKFHNFMFKIITIFTFIIRFKAKMYILVRDT